VAVYNHYKRLAWQGDGKGETDQTATRLHKSQHPADRPDRLRQDAAGPDPGRACSTCRFAIADATTLTEAGYVGEDVENILLQAAAGGRSGRRAGPAGHHLHRRDRQDRPQEREPLDHPRRLRARACSRPCSRCSRARWPTCRPRGAASTRTRSASRSTPASILFICGGAFVGLGRCGSEAPGSQRHRLHQRRWHQPAPPRPEPPGRRSAAASGARRSGQVRADPGIHWPPAGDRRARAPRCRCPAGDPRPNPAMPWSKQFQTLLSMDNVRLAFEPDADRGDRRSRPTAARPAPGPCAASSKS
jgi:ATP-dependent Clp protease ATP-binding subunit ClpX